MRNGPSSIIVFQAAQRAAMGLTSAWNVGNVGSNRPYVILCQFTS
jgi:hypothetical protein